MNGEHPGSETAFGNCVKDEKCNFDAVSGYMRNFEQVERIGFSKLIVESISISSFIRTVTMMDRSSASIISKFMVKHFSFLNATKDFNFFYYFPVFGGYGCVGDLPIHLQKKYDDCMSGNV